MHTSDRLSDGLSNSIHRSYPRSNSLQITDYAKSNFLKTWNVNLFECIG